MNEIIKKVRLEHNMTQKELAKILGISESHIGMIEQGRRTLPDKSKIKFCDYFNISLDYLFGREKQI